MRVRSDANKIPQCEETFPWNLGNISPAPSWQCPHTSPSWADTTAAKRMRGACQHKAQFALALTKGLQTQIPSSWECHERSGSSVHGPFPERHPRALALQGQTPGWARAGETTQKRSIHCSRMVQEVKLRLWRQDTPPAPCPAGKGL